MKTTTYKQNKKLAFFRKAILFVFVFTVFSIKAQVQNQEPLFIGDNGFVYLQSDTYYFGAGNGLTKTSRTPSTYGKLVFSSNTIASGASNTHYLDGYGSIISTAPFVFPIGQSGIYAPVKVTPSTVMPIDAAYYRANPTQVGGSIDSAIGNLSNLEYWHVLGNNAATISLSWSNASMLGNLASLTSELTIVGFDGAQWVEIPSTVDATSFLGGNSSLTSGSISSTGNVDVSTFTYFTIGTKADACNPLVASSGNTKTWNGSWSPSAPTIADPVIINADYAAGSFDCNSLVLNANVTLENGQYVEIVYGVTGTGKFIMASEANVVQRASGVAAPNIELNKKTRSVMRQFDYIYWGTPIAGDFFDQLAGAQACTGVSAGAFDLKYKYATGAGGGWQTLSAVETAKGYIMRIKAQEPFTTASATDCINLKFTGVANNGDITLPITNNPSFPNAGTSHVLLANPYPSAIDANKFLTYNNDIDGVVYIWTSATLTPGTVQPYSQADYIAYTLAGSVIPNNLPTTFNGKIASGQGFKVKSKATAGTVTFNNCMRLKDGNDQFYKVNNTVAPIGPIDRFKLNMTGNNAVFSQILVSYMPQTTLEYDRMYDAGRNSVSTAQLYSIFEGDGRKLAINARPNFFVSDVVPLGVSKADTTAEDFTISIVEQEGIFATNLVTVYLHDKALGTYIDLASAGSYTFSSATTALNDRFEIVYANPLANPQFSEANVMAFIKNATLNIIAGVEMEGVEVFDVTGRKIFTATINSLKNYNTPFNHAQAVYLLKVKLTNGKLATFKLINQK